MYKIIRCNEEMEVKSADIKPGDILIIHKDQKFPADVVILKTSFDDGTAYIETSDLDG
jgi:P-type E1-E2 ATPase